MRTTVLLLLLAVATTFQLTAQKTSDFRADAEQGDAESYIMEIDDDEIYIKVFNTEIGDILSVMGNSGYITDPKTGDKFQKKLKVIGQIKVEYVTSNYIVGKVYGDSIPDLAKEMVVRKTTTVPLIAAVVPAETTTLSINSNKEPTVMIAPVELNFSQENIKVKNIDNYVSNALAHYLLKSGKIQLEDRTPLMTPQNKNDKEQSSEINYNTARQYGKAAGVRYFVNLTLQKPNVSEFSYPIDIKEWTSSQSDFQKYIPNKVEVKNVAASVKIVASVVDLQTGKVLFTKKGKGAAKGKAEIVMDSQITGSVTLTGENKNIEQTVIEDAIDKAVEKLGEKLNFYFSEFL